MTRDDRPDVAAAPREAGRSSRADLQRVHRYTAVTLWAMTILLIAAQLILALGESFDGRIATLTILSVASLLAMLALIPQLLRDPLVTPPSWPLVAVMAALALATWVVANLGEFAGWGWAISLAMAAGIVLCLVAPWRRVGLTVLLILVLIVARIAQLLGAGAEVTAAAIFGSIPETLGIIATVALLPFTYLSVVWTLHVLIRMDRARSLASELAVARERLRFATDLHDIQGHNLQVIALKSELAERLLTRDPEGAARELRAIREISQAALDDTRAVVNDYRTVTAAVELRNAAAILRSAGMSCTVTVDTGEISETTGAVLGVAIREATTNLLRHSRAETAGITLHHRDGAYHLRVINDGARLVRGEGTGLRGLSERVGALGGSVSSHREGTEFTLSVTIPDIPEGTSPISPEEKA